MKIIYEIINRYQANETLWQVSALSTIIKVHLLYGRKLGIKITAGDGKDKVNI